MRSKDHKFSSMENNIYLRNQIDGVTDSVWSFFFGDDGCSNLSMPKHVGILIFLNIENDTE